MKEILFRLDHSGFGLRTLDSGLQELTLNLQLSTLNQLSTLDFEWLRRHVPQ